MSDSSWIDKYSPTKVSELIGNKTAVTTIINWFENFGKEGTKNSLLAIGNHGTGKTTAVKLITKRFGYEIIYINPTNIKDKQEILNSFDRSVSNPSVVELINSKKKSKKALVIDEIESITLSKNKKYILNILKENSAERKCPLIFISNNKHNKLLLEIKKLSENVHFYNLYYNDMRRLVLKIMKAEKIRISGGPLELEDTLEMIINHSQYDISRLICILQEIKYTFPISKLNLDDVTEYVKSSKKKDMDYDLYEASNMLLHNYKSIDECLRYYETEKVLLPLMMHENYPLFINNNIASDQEKIKLSRTIINYLSRGDIIENYIYGNQNWELQDIHGFHMCVLPSFCCKMNKQSRKFKLVFTSDLNKTSIQRINKKNIIRAKENFTNMDVLDFININHIVKHLLAKNDIKECVKIFKAYGIKKDNIESLLKIDKISPVKTKLTTKQKKKIISLLQ